MNQSTDKFTEQLTLLNQSLANAKTRAEKKAVKKQIKKVKKAQAEVQSKALKADHNVALKAKSANHQPVSEPKLRNPKSKHDLKLAKKEKKAALKKAQAEVQSKALKADHNVASESNSSDHQPVSEPKLRNPKSKHDLKLAKKEKKAALKKAHHQKIAIAKSNKPVHDQRTDEQKILDKEITHLQAEADQLENKIARAKVADIKLGYQKQQKIVTAKLEALQKQRALSDQDNNSIQDKNVVTGKKAVAKLKQRQRYIAKLSRTNSKSILKDHKIISLTNYKPDVKQFVIELANVNKSYITGELEYKVLKHFQLKIKRNSFVAILGPSGSGKTTLLNIISGLDKASDGDVFVDGLNLTLLSDTDLTKFRRDKVGFIFQQYNLLTNLTAKENAEVGANLARNKKGGLKIKDIFQTIGMTEEMDKYPYQLSGGQQQRVSIARALAKNPSILFCDEPTGALDETMGRKVLEILIEVNKKYKTTIVAVTHNPNIALIADTVIHIKNGIISEIIHNEHPKSPSEIKWG